VHAKLQAINSHGGCLTLATYTPPMSTVSPSGAEKRIPYAWITIMTKRKLINRSIGVSENSETINSR